MNEQRRDRLDDAIDATAARMTAVADDDSLALRIVSSLPERSAWSLHWLMPRLALTAVLAMATAFGVLRSFDDRSATVLPTENAGAPMVELAAPVERTIVERRLIGRRTIVEPPSNLRRTAVDGDRPDHAFSLPAIKAAAALNIDALTPANLPEDAPLTVESLEIADLPLTADFISPR